MNAGSGTPAVELGSVSLTLGGDPIIDDISLQVGSDEFVAIVGPSGCGKTSLLRIIAGLIEPTPVVRAGAEPVVATVLVDGVPADVARSERRVAMAFQDAGLLEWRSVMGNVELPLQIAGWEPARRRARARELLDLVGLGDFERHKPWELSGGMQQRVALARTLAATPKVLLLDEPFASVDEMTRHHLQDELVSVRADGGPAAVLVTHSVTEAVFLADRVVVLTSRPAAITQVIETSAVTARSGDLLHEYAQRVRGALD